MSTGQKHIIEKVYLEVNTTSESQAYHIKNNLVDSFLKDVLLSKIEKLLNEYDIENKIFRFEEMVLDFSVSEWKNEREIALKFENNLNKKLRKELNVISETSKSSTKKKEIPEVQNHENVFLFFLENGFLPWYGKENYIIEINKSNNWKRTIQEIRLQEKLISLFSQNENALRRFVFQFTAAKVIDFVVELQPKKTGMKNELSSLLKSFPGNVRLQLLQIIVQLSVQKKSKNIIQNLYSLVYSILKTKPETGQKIVNTSFENLKEFVSNHISEKKEIETAILTILEKNEENILHEYIEENSDKIDSKKQNGIEKDDSFFEDKPTDIIIQNAGLVLLHPFLKIFFSEIGILNETGNILIENQMLAVQALNYLATGNEEFFEANMIFEKYMIGMPLKMPVLRKSLLTDEIKTKANEMLNHVIKNWRVLKNTSPDALREAFLQREGKLMQTKNEYKIIVERKTLDVLLEKLSWNISVIKFPWRKEILFVEW